MNTTSNQTEKLPFPSHVTAAAPNQITHEFSRQIVDNSMDANNVLAAAGNVHKFVRNHYVDISTGTYGIEKLIANILKARGAAFPSNVMQTEFAAVALNCSMFASEIISEVRQTYGADRYPDSTIYTYLAVFMTKQNSQNKVGKIKLTGKQDANRTCCKPRAKYFIIE